MSRHAAVVERHFDVHATERAPTERLTDLFSITWASRERMDNSSFSLYLLKPKAHTAEIYGFERELLLLYSPYSTVEPRTLIQVDEMLEHHPRLRGRCEVLYLVLIAPVDDMSAELARYRQDADLGRIIIGFSERELLENQDPWLLRERFSSTLFSRDLFDMKQALVADSYFFGRQALVLDLLDRSKRGENTGVFGLRKTGKTSTLFKLRRSLETEKAGWFVYLDVQNPALHTLRWWELLSVIKDEAATAAGVALPPPLDRPFTQATAMRRTQDALREVLERGRNAERRLVVVVDEIEHICPGLSSERHWDDDFLPFWKLLRAIQTQDRRLTIIIAGVNAQATEHNAVGRQDNPLFSLVGTRYLQPFSAQETKDMVTTLGRRMGILFDSDACAYLSARYGGHPMLVRLACSWEHQRRIVRGTEERPVRITADALASTESEREQDLIPYANHVLDVLRQWYPDEYALLELLAEGDAEEFALYYEQMPESIQHLRGYGLLDSTGKAISIAMLAAYLRASARRPVLIRPNDRPSVEAAAHAAGAAVLTQQHGGDGRDRGVAGLSRDVAPLTSNDVTGALARGEDALTEFKSTLRYNLKAAKYDATMEHAVLKTIAAFLNTEGGMLLVGVDDSGTPLGIAADGFPNEDKMTLHLVNLIRERIGAEHNLCIRATYHTVADKRILAIQCLRSERPVYLRASGNEQFYVRLLAATTELSIQQAHSYIAIRFKKS